MTYIENDRIKEVIGRRYNFLLKRNLTLPDLILIDGGKGQLNAGISVLDELGLNIPVIGLAKKNEEIYVPNKKEPCIYHWIIARMVVQTLFD